MHFMVRRKTDLCRGDAGRRTDRFFKLCSSNFKLADDDSNVFLMLTRAMASGKRILDVLDEEIDLKEDPEATGEIKAGEIEFRNVSFKYKKRRKKNMCFRMYLFILNRGRR